MNGAHVGMRGAETGERVDVSRLRGQLLDYKVEPGRRVVRVAKADERVDVSRLRGHQTVVQG